MKLAKNVVVAGLLGLTAGCANKTPPAPSTPPPNVAEFDKVKDPPIAARTHFAAGQLNESQSEFEKAIDQYRMALKLDPKYADAMYRLGIVLTATKDFPAALETWEKYVALTNSATAYSNLGFCEEMAGNPSAAEGAYRKGIARDPSNEPCHVNFGLMLARHGRPAEGLLQLQAVLPPAQAHYDLASLYQMMGRKKEAKAEYAKALEIDPQFDDAKSKLALLGD